MWSYEPEDRLLMSAGSPHGICDAFRRSASLCLFYALAFGFRARLAGAVGKRNVLEKARQPIGNEIVLSSVSTRKPSISRHASPAGDVSLPTLAFMRFGIQIDERLSAPEFPAHSFETGRETRVGSPVKAVPRGLFNCRWPATG